MKDSFKEERITKNYIEDKKKNKFDRQFCHLMFCVMTN